MPDAATATPQPPPKFKVFLRRLLSFVILWTIVLSALFSGNKLLSDYQAAQDKLDELNPRWEKAMKELEAATASLSED